jgi:hypothetical protein
VKRKIAVLGVAVLLPATMFAASYADEDGDQDTTASATASAAAADLPPDAPQPVSKEHQAVDDIASLVTNLEMEPGYGKVAVDYAKHRVDVLWRGEVPAAVTDAVEAGSKAGVEVTVAQSTYSQGDVYAAARSIMEKYKGIQAVGPNDDRSGLVVAVDEKSEFARDSERFAAEFAAVGGIPATIEIGWGAPIPATR